MHTHAHSTLTLCKPVPCLHPSQMYSGCHCGAMVTNHKPSLKSCLYYWHEAVLSFLLVTQQRLQPIFETQIIGRHCSKIHCDNRGSVYKLHIVLLDPILQDRCMQCGHSSLLKYTDILCSMYDIIWASHCACALSSVSLKGLVARLISHPIFHSSFECTFLSVQRAERPVLIPGASDTAIMSCPFTSFLYSYVNSSTSVRGEESNSTTQRRLQSH